jgi:hypothetical protein
MPQARDLPVVLAGSISGLTESVAVRATKAAAVALDRFPMSATTGE